jgi:hypothetical protein
MECVLLSSLEEVRSESDGALGIIAPCVSSEIAEGSTAGEGTSRRVIMCGRCRVEAPRRV